MKIDLLLLLSNAGFSNAFSRKVVETELRVAATVSAMRISLLLILPYAFCLIFLANPATRKFLSAVQKDRSHTSRSPMSSM